ncbi:MAG: hypothetical protein HY568_06510 [Candidatus Latescibacteria bacterium]|nr:hypothetical protein [Candidatus Latescibacterota bacterium]
MLATDRGAGWNLMLSQPLVGACLAGALLNPGPQWELWALRIPIGVGVLLQLLLTDPALPAAQRPRDAATAGVIGVSVALLGLERLHPSLPVSTGGILWVVIGTITGLLVAIAGGWMDRSARAATASRLARADDLAREGRVASFEALFWGGVFRIFLRGAIWSAGATAVGVALSVAFLPHMALLVTGPRTGLLFAVIMGLALGAGWHTHVRARSSGVRWAAIGALTTLILLLRFRGGEP